MRTNLPVTQREVPLANDDALISTTDVKGVILSVNEDFCRIAGFDEEELLGQAHNIVRHPDMPQLAFRDLWDVCKKHRPWMGLVKNRCKNGDHYYVDAYVTPIYDEGKVTGFQSVRVKPDKKVVDRAETIYASIRENKSRWLQKVLPANLSYRMKASLTALLVALPALWGGWLPALLTLITAFVLLQLLVGPVVKLAEESKQYFENPITQLVYTGRGDELGQLGLVMQALRAQNRTILGRVRNSAQALDDVASGAMDIVDKTTSGVDRQQSEVEQIAAAMNEMSATVSEVAKHAEQTAASSQQVLKLTKDGEQVVNETVTGINDLSVSVQEATDVMGRLRQQSEQIGSVVDVISNIASETNLLALNAAIEAARAGEQGRGFAVVADEVRNLAGNTQKSTDEIQAMIKSIQASSNEAMEQMNQSKEIADKNVVQIEELGSSFDEISQGVERINDMNAQVATASEEQSAVSEEINRNVTGIMNVANETHDHAAVMSIENKRLLSLVDDLRLMVRQFGKV